MSELMERSDNNTSSNTTTDGVDRAELQVTVGDKKSVVAPPPAEATTTCCETPSSPAPSGRKISIQCTPESKSGGRAFESPVIGKALGLDLEDKIFSKSATAPKSTAAEAADGSITGSNSSSSGSSSRFIDHRRGNRSAREEMPPPPKTPTRRGRRSAPRTRTPAKPRTPSGGLTALRLGLKDDDDKEGDNDDDESEGSKLTPRKTASGGPNRVLEMTPTKRRAFGRKEGSPWKPPVTIPPEVSKVYGIVAKATGSVGGNGSSGAIYGELTAGCMQKVVNVLKEETAFDENSSFIDVGSGLGKPNFHVAQDPGCEISYGLELEEVRWQLSVVNHRRLLRDGGSKDLELKKHNIFFAHGDILSAKTFDPFTHVYMFDVGFPPDTLIRIAKIFNGSQARHLISYQFPHKIEEYGFDVDMILKMPLRLTGSKEGHTMYLYRRKNVAPGLPASRITEVDPFFARGVSLCRDGGDGSELTQHVEGCFLKNTSGGIRTRRSRRASP